MPGLTLRRDSAASYDFDLVRGLAAVVVLLGHWRNLFFVTYGEVSAPTRLDQILYFFTGYGHQAVIVFFVMSGYLVGSGVIRNIDEGKWSWRKYAVNRFTRLYVVLIPALIVGGLLDSAGIHWFGVIGPYAGAGFANMFPVPVQDRLGAVPLIGNLGFLQTIGVPTFGSNGPLWSLANEFWYYILFPLFWLSLRLPGNTLRRVIYLGLGLGVAVLIGMPILSLFGVWLLGAAIAQVTLPRTLGHSLFRWLSGLGFVSAAVLIRLNLVPEGLFADYFLGVMFALWSASTLMRSDRVCSEWYRHCARAISERSYTLYLVHLPALVFAYTWIVGSSGPWQPSLKAYATGVIVLMGTLIYSELMWRLFESKTERIRRRLSDRVLVRA